ncbi:hypothetical protein ACJIZ3_014354 [Penstemon smallii]|uniref:Calcium-transporting ATPase n=1 Tax=Penstemon smallii TaxID=265156 RepID=A0ABD3RQX5_9LAMI
MFSTSSAYYHRQTAPTSFTGYYEIPPATASYSCVIDIKKSPMSNFSSSTTNIDKSVLNTLVKNRREDEFNKLGGVNGIGISLNTDKNRGINGSTEDILSRTKAYGANTFLVPPTKSFLHFVMETFKNLALVILLVCGAILLGFGVKQHGVKQGCYNRGSIICAVMAVISISAICNFAQYKKLNKHFKETEIIESQVVRDGIQVRISMFEIVVGDIVCLYTGDHVPADGLFIEGHSLVLDESSSIHHVTGVDNMHVRVNRNENPFLFSGTKVVDGNAKMLVTCVGTKSSWGEKIISNYESDEKTLLQTQLNELSSSVGKVGLAVALLVLVVLLLRYFIGNNYKEFNGSKYENVIDHVVEIIAASLTIVVVSVPEGLALAVTIAILCSMKRMMADNAMVRTISACETMGSIKTMCIDIIGTLSSNKMTVTMAFISSTTESMERKSYTFIPPNVRQLFIKGVNLLRYSVEKRLADTNIDDAVFQWAHSVQNIETDQSLTYNNVMEHSCFEKNRIGILVKGRFDENIINVYWRGDAETIIASCSHYFDSTGSTIPLDEQEKGTIQQILENMASSGLLCIAYAYKRLTRAERANIETEIPDTHLTLLGYVGLKFLHQPGTKEAVEICQQAGINVKMITSENVLISTAIAREYGILSSHDQELVVEGAEFRNYTEEERNENIEKIRVMASSSPSDKLLMVNCLKNNGHVVGVTGDSIKDALSLSKADIVISMRNQGTDEVAKQCSDIVILDDNFASIAKALRWGRGVYNNIQKFIQFQVTFNVVALAINVVVVVSSGELALTTVELLWVNFIMDTLGALALATEKPSNGIMSVPPVGITEPLITNVMWRNIISQALYQIAVILFFRFKGINKSFFRTHEIVFTSFVFLQISNLFNARKLEKKNVFEGVFCNKSFLGIIGITITLQVVMVELLNKFANTERLDWKEWGLCVGIAVLSWPIGCLVKFIPVQEAA